MEKPANPAGRCECGHVKYLHRPGWCRGYLCRCWEFKPMPKPMEGE